MATKESSLSNILASSQNIRVKVNQNQVRMRCNWVRKSPKVFAAVCERLDVHIEETGRACLLQRDQEYCFPQVYS